MVDSISLSADIRQALLVQQRTAEDIAITTERIATNRQINRATDDAVAYFKAQDLSNRASDLLAAKDSISQSLSSIEAATTGLNAISDTLGQLRALAESARNGSAEERAAVAELYDQVVTQLDYFANDTTYDGVGLISNPPQDLDVVLNDTGETLTVSSQAADSTGLGISPAVTDLNNFATDADIDTALAQLNTAETSIRVQERSFQTDVGVLNVREQFSTELSSTLQSGAADLVEADLNEEAANLLALQVRQQLGVVALNLVAEKNNAVATLF